MRCVIIQPCHHHTRPLVVTTGRLPILQNKTLAMELLPDYCMQSQQITLPTRTYSRTHTATLTEHKETFYAGHAIAQKPYRNTRETHINSPTTTIQWHLTAIAPRGHTNPYICQPLHPSPLRLQVTGTDTHTSNTVDNYAHNTSTASIHKAIPVLNTNTFRPGPPIHQPTTVEHLLPHNATYSHARHHPTVLNISCLTASLFWAFH